MDTNSLQPIKKDSELVLANGRASIRSFEMGFINTTNAVGVLPVSIVASYLITVCLVSILSRELIFTGAIVPVILTSSFVTIVIWIGLSLFRWPLPVRVVLAVWSALVVGLLALIQMLSEHFLPENNGASLIFAILTNGYVLTTYIIPSVVAGSIALIPYLYREHLNKNGLITSSNSTKLIEPEKTIGTQN